MVIVVAEGAGNGVQDIEQLKENVVKDDSGNKKLPVTVYLFRILVHF